MGLANWLRTKIHNFIFPQDTHDTLASPRVRESHDADIEGLRFTVMPARGGTIIQIRTYDHKRDESNSVTYVVPEGEDIAARVGEIVSIELMKV